MNRRRLPPHLPLLVLLLAGCAAPAATPVDAPTLAVEIDHDHAALAGHDDAHGFDRVGHLALDELLGGEPGRASDIQFHGDLAAVAVNGGSGGFVLLDAKDPRHLVPLARYRSGSEDNWYVKFTPDGARVLLTANGGTAPAPAAQGALEALTRGTLTHAARGLQVVDIRDPRAPRLESVYEAPIRLINAATWAADGVTYVAVSVVNDRAVLGAPKPGALANEVRILRLGGAVPEEVGRWAPPADAGPEVFVHDLAVEVHPVTHATLLYAACWDAGAYVLDVSAPDDPAVVGSFRPEGETPQVHTVKPHPGLVDGRHLTLVSPETFGGQESGRYHLLDTTDPTRPSLVATWTLPGELANPEPLLWSPHEFTLAEGKAWTSNFHAGVIALDLSAGLAPVAWWAAPAESPREASARWVVDVETAVWRDGLVYAVDMGRGVDVLAPRP